MSFSERRWIGLTRNGGNGKAVIKRCSGILEAVSGTGSKIVYEEVDCAGSRAFLTALLAALRRKSGSEHHPGSSIGIQTWNSQPFKAIKHSLIHI